MLFNQGLSSGELFTNAPESLRTRKWKWLFARYGKTNSYEEALSAPFKYCFSLVLNRIIDDRVRFKMPVPNKAYIDFEIVSGDKFIKQRQNGRFSEIDFVESDFTGYFLNYFYNNKRYERNIPIYVGGSIKKKFLEGINSGIKYYTIKDITVDDFIDQVCEKFSELTRKEVISLVNFGFRRMHYAIRYGCTISMISRKYNCLAYIGNLTLLPEKQIKEYSVRRDRKLRKIVKWKKLSYDGYYYIGLNPTTFEKWVEDNKKSKTIAVFNNIISRMLQEELYYKAKHVYIFRFKKKKHKGWVFWSDKLKIRKLEFIGESYENKFTPSNKTWQELIKEYEKGND